MTNLSLYSEPYAGTGNIGDGGFRRLLGAPSLDTLSLVLREALQNSCDAAKAPSGPAVFINIRTLSKEQVALAKTRIFAELPFIRSSKAAIEAFLRSPRPRVLEIVDFNTVGLGGPTRADRVRQGARQKDFIDFLRNVGSQRNSDLGGGTYGFGKASLYSASKCSTILVDTRTGPDDSLERRLIGCHLGEAGDRPAGKGYVKLYTGRHWWGTTTRGNEAEPATGSLADRLAQGMGFPERNETQSGTTIAVLDPDLGDANDEEIAARIVECLLVNFWPRLMKSTPKSKKLKLSLSIEGVGYDIPAPETCPPLDLYCRAMDMLRDQDASVEAISSDRPKKHLGNLAIAKGLRSRRLPQFSAASWFEGSASHIALMRPVELVVTYSPGPPLPDEATEWAGVFIADKAKEVEAAFARSEPAAHDAWEPKNMPRGPEQTYVRVALRRIQDAARSVAAPPSTSGTGGHETTPLAAVSGRLGAFLADTSHGGPSIRRGSGGGNGSGGQKSRRRVSLAEFVRLEMSPEGRVAVFQVTVTGASSANTLVLEPTLALDGGSLSASKLEGAPRPRILDVCGEDLAFDLKQGRATIGAFEGDVRVRVTVPDECAVGLQTDLQEG